MYEWNKEDLRDWVHYQNAVKTQSYQDRIYQQSNQIKELQNTINSFSELMTSEIKDYLQRMFADKLNLYIYKKIVKAIQKSGMKEDRAISLIFSSNALRFLNPQQIQALVLDRFMMHIKKDGHFGITNYMSRNGVIRTYSIDIPRMTYNFSKVEDR